MRKSLIIPSIYNFEFNLIKECLEKILKSDEISMVHFDGLIDLNNFQDLLRKYNIIADVHLLSDNPLSELKTLLKMNLDIPMRVSMHIESDDDTRMFSKIAKKNQLSPGIAIKLKTPIPSEVSFCDGFDYVHLICNDEILGLSNFQNEVLDKMEFLHELLENKCTITIDAGVKEDNILPSIGKGASNIVMGSAIFKNENPLEAIIKFNRIAQVNKIG